MLPGHRVTAHATASRSQRMIHLVPRSGFEYCQILGSRVACEEHERRTLLPHTQERGQRTQAKKSRSILVRATVAGAPARRSSRAGQPILPEQPRQRMNDIAHRHDGHAGRRRPVLARQVCAHSSTSTRRQPDLPDWVTLGAKSYVDGETRGQENTEFHQHCGDGLIPETETELGRIIAGQRKIRQVNQDVQQDSGRKPPDPTIAAACQCRLVSRVGQE